MTFLSTNICYCEPPPVSFIYVIHAKEINVMFSVKALGGLFSGFLMAGVAGVPAALSRGCCFTVLQSDADVAGSGDPQSHLFISDSETMTQSVSTPDLCL